MGSLDERIEREVAALGELPREELVARWIKAYGCTPPKGVKLGLLARAAAWHLQARHLGGLSPTARRAIRDAAKLSAKLREGRGGASASPAPHDPQPRKFADLPAVKSSTLRPGTRLMREWNGRVHAVDVSEDGFVFDGKTYRSLTALARRITGAHWSGPRFFGI